MKHSNTTGPAPHRLGVCGELQIYQPVKCFDDLERLDTICGGVH